VLGENGSEDVVTGSPLVPEDVMFVIQEEYGPVVGVEEMLRLPLGDTEDGVTITVKGILVRLVAVLLISIKLVVRLVVVSVTLVTGATVSVVLG